MEFREKYEAMEYAAPETDKAMPSPLGGKGARSRLPHLELAHRAESVSRLT